MDDPKDSLQSIEEQMKVVDATKEECFHQAMDEPTVKSVTRMLQGTAKSMPTITIMSSSNRVWDPTREYTMC